MEVKTVAVEHADGHMIINDSDFDPKVHKLVDLPEPAPAVVADDEPITEGSPVKVTVVVDALEAMKVSDLRARVKAAEIKLSDIEGSGEGGNVIKDDLVRVLRAHDAAKAE